MVAKGAVSCPVMIFSSASRCAGLALSSTKAMQAPLPSWIGPGHLPCRPGAMNLAATQPLAEYREVDARRFARELVPLGEPAVLRGLVRDWPAVRQALHSPEAICRYLMQLDSGAPVDALLMRPE